MPYVYKRPKRRVLSRSVFRNRAATKAEGLTGFVLGEPASDLEERFYRAVSRLPQVRSIQFQLTFGAPSRNMYGAATLDFLIDAGTLIPVQIDGVWIHRSPGDRMEEFRKDQKIFDKLKRRGNVEQVVRIIEKYVHNQEKAESSARQLLAGRRDFVD